MAHEHQHSHSHSHSDVKNIKAAFFLNFFFAIVELIGGWMTNSTAILSDAIHDFGDSVSLGLAWYLQRLSKKGRTSSYSYGYKRFSLLGAVINSVVLLTGSILVLTVAVPRIFNPQPTKPEGMLLLAVVGILVNGFAVLRTRKGTSLNEKVVSLHLLEDVLGWIAILVGSVVMMFFSVPVLDPLMSVAITLYVLYNVFRNIRRSLRVILQGIPAEIHPDELAEELRSMDVAEDIHDLHVWSVDGEYNVLTVHIVTTKPYSMEELAEVKVRVREVLKQKGIQHATIEFETPDEKCCFEECCS